jgi:hypothetical protein
MSKFQLRIKQWAAAAILGAFTVGSAWADDCPSITSYGAVANSVAAGEANTAAINTALQSSPCVSVPHGVFWVSVSSGGIVLRSGSTLQGAGSESSMLIAKDRSSGSMLKRAAPQAKGDYVTGVTVRNLGVVMNSAPYRSGGTSMVGIDFRHVSGSVISDVYVGNIPSGVASAATSGWVTSTGDVAQGVGILLCTMSSSQPLYSGGERNVVERARVWGAKIGISIDDPGYCPGSGAHATTISNSDIQFVEYGIAQQSRYTAGLGLRGNVIQSLVASGDVGTTLLLAYVIAGTAGTVDGGYIEVGSANPAQAIYLTDDSKGNDVSLGRVSIKRNGVGQPLSQLIRAGGVQNKIRGFDEVGGTWVVQP